MELSVAEAGTAVGAAEEETTKLVAVDTAEAAAETMEATEAGRAVAELATETAAAATSKVT